MVELSRVMDALGEALQTVDASLRVFPYPQPSVSPPAAVVGWPYDLEPNLAVARGGWSATFPVLIAVGKADPQSARDTLDGYLRTLRDALNRRSSGYDSAQWTGGRVEPITIAGVEYLAAILDVEVVGRGRT